MQLPVSRASLLLFHIAAAAVLLAALAGCAAPEEVKLPSDVPAQWLQAPALPASDAGADTASWWTRWDDPVLDGLVDDALAANLDVAQAAARLRQQRLLAGAAVHAYHPTVSAGARTLEDVTATDSFFQASIDMIWDLGLFGAAEANERAVRSRVLDADAQAHAARVAVVAEVVHRYLDIRLAQRQRTLFAQMQRLDDEAVGLAQVRREQRLGTQDDVLQARAQAQARRAASAQVLEAQARSAHALAVLLGRVEPQAAWLQEDARSTLPQAADAGIAVLPASLLRSRPDIREAEARVEEAAAQVGLARSALYPRFQLVGSLLYSYNITRNFRNNGNSMPAAGPMIDIPLFDWGRRRAQVDANEQALQASILAYRQSVLAGVAEVESSLAALSAQRTRQEALAESSRLLEQRSKVQQQRSELGLGSRWASLPDLLAVLQSQSDIATAQAARALAYVALYKALGGAPQDTETAGLQDHRAPASDAGRGPDS